jgi:putative oxidoreductase
MQRWHHWIAWAEARRDLWLDLIRIYLGLGLFARGLLFVSNSSSPFIINLMQRPDNQWIVTGVALHYIIAAHLIGGALLTAGLFTRLAALFQIPVLVGAVFIVHARDGLFAMGQSLELSALVLFLLCMFLVSGAGKLSLDHLVFRTELPSADHPHPTQA